MRDVYIARKLDKFGKRFGFVRFSDVDNPKWLEAQLGKIWIGDFNLRVNISMFNREGKEASHAKNNMNNNQFWGGGGGGVKGGVSYATAVQSERHKGNQFRQSTRGGINVPNTKQTAGWSGMAFNVSEEQMSWLKGCYVGQTINPKGIPNIQEELLNEGLFTINAAPMDGNLVLLSPLEAEDLSVIINDQESTFAKWFSKIRIWGLGGRIKKSAIRSLIVKQKLDFLCIQETKMEIIDQNLCDQLWGGTDVGWVARQSMGNSGGLLCLWKKGVFDMVESFSEEGFLGIKGRWGEAGPLCLSKYL